MSKKTTRIPFTTESVDEDSKTIEFVMSTNDEDRHGDKVKQNWKLDSFMENPVFINSHNYEDAAEALGKVVEITQSNDSLEGKVKFAVDENPKAKVIYDLYKGGFLNAVSVGFREMQDKAENVVNELLELSAVTVPANAMATAKAKGIDTEPLEEEIEEETKKEIKEMIEQKSPECREEGETEEECIERKIPEIIEDQNVDRSQAAAIAFSMCSEFCSEQESIQKEGRVLAEVNRKDVQKIKDLANRILVRAQDNKSKEKDVEEDEEIEEDKETEPQEEKPEEAEPQEEEDEKKEDDEKEEEVEEENEEEKVMKGLKKVKKQVNGLRAENAKIKKRNIYKAIRNLEDDIEA